VTHRVANSWSSGYTGEIVIENRGASVDGWTLTFSAPGVTVAQGWNGTWTDTGDTVRVLERQTRDRRYRDHRLQRELQRWPATVPGPELERGGLLLTR
jgi:cellulose binding protein with CBM2 domain